MRVSDVLKSNRQNSRDLHSRKFDRVNLHAAERAQHWRLPVCDAHGALVGIISERDVVRAFAKDVERDWPTGMSATS